MMNSDSSEVSIFFSQIVSGSNFIGLGSFNSLSSFSDLGKSSVENNCVFSHDSLGGGDLGIQLSDMVVEGGDLSLFGGGGMGQSSLELSSQLTESGDYSVQHTLVDEVVSFE
jgi:hypothetical protein